LAACHRALLHQITTGDAMHALVLLQRGVVAESARKVQTALRSGAGVSWVHSAPGPAAAQLQAPAQAILAGAAAEAPAGWWLLPLDHLTQRVGVLCLERRTGDSLTELDSLVECAATLVATAVRTASSGAHNEAELMRAALRGAGTFVWEWDVASDVLSDLDEGFALLGYARTHAGHTQQDWNALIHPDDREANHEAYLRHERGEAEQYEHVYRARGAGGQWRWLHERGRIVERGADGRPRRMLGTQADITRQHELEDSVSQATRRLQRIASHVPGVLYQFMHSADGERGWFPFVSERCRAVFGLSPETLMADAAALLRMVDRDWRDRLLASVRASARDGSLWRLEFPIHRPDGESRWLLGAASPQAEADGATAWYGYIADVTDLRELEAARRDKAAAEAASHAKTEFLSRMSHELRTPLNAVIGFAQLLELGTAPPLPDPQRRHVGLIREAGEHLLHMIGDLLDLTRIEAGQLALNWEAVDLAALADECLAMLQAQATEAAISLQSELRACALPALRADRTRLKQVLINLLSNAVKYNRRGGSVRVRAAQRAGQIVLEVIDSGLGIAPEHLAQLFEPFQRGAHAHSTIEGTGIGLAVSRSLVELMGGQLAVSSTPGEGSVFSVLLPA
jgi:PAS domain S-box-containing protein